MANQDRLTRSGSKSTWVAKPPRIRSACTNCNRAKVELLSPLIQVVLIVVTNYRGSYAAVVSQVDALDARDLASPVCTPSLWWAENLKGIEQEPKSAEKMTC